jgi:hypothetical protein
MKSIKVIAGILFATAFVVLSNSCATMFSGTRQSVTFHSEPSSAKVTNSKGELICITPCSQEVKRKFKSVYTFSKAGYPDGTVTLKGSFNPSVLWNILWLPWPVFGIDYATGAAWKYGQTTYLHAFPDAEKYQQDPTIRAGEATKMVSRDNPGGTALERTIIRWNFESDPRGARVFWRVISSIPDQVKNTNETYLTTTPYEETRSFNILGLTYENSRDVTIEVKVRRKGYFDQVKRYNVRQAIDQQEISGFFELVKDEELGQTHEINNFAR